MDRQKIIDDCRATVPGRDEKNWCIGLVLDALAAAGYIVSKATPNADPSRPKDGGDRPAWLSDVRRECEKAKRAGAAMALREWVAASTRRHGYQTDFAASLINVTSEIESTLT